MIRLLCLIFVLAVIGQIQGESYSRYDESVQIVKQQKNKITMIMVTSSSRSCYRCNMAREVFERVQRLHPYIKAVQVDCERMKTEEESEYIRVKDACDDFSVLPHITVFEMESDDKSKRWPQDHIFTGMVSEEHLVSYADRLMLNYFQLIESRREHKTFLEERKHNFKVLYFADRKDDSENINPFLKTLSARFRDQISFGFIDYDYKSLRKLYPAIHQTEKTLIFLSPQDMNKFEEGKYNYFEFQDGELEGSNYNRIENFVYHKLQQSIRLSDTSGEGFIETPSTSINTQELAKLMKTSNGWILLELKGSTSQHSLPQLPQIKQDFRNMFEYYELIVSNGDEQTQEFIWNKMGLVENLPQTIIYPLGRKNLNYFVRLNQNQDNFNSQDLAQQLLQYVTPSETSLEEYLNDKSEMAKNWAQKYHDQKKTPVIWFYNHADLIQQLYIQTFSNLNKYRKDFVFGKIHDPSEQQQKEWQIQNSFPQILAITDVKEGQFQRLLSASKDRDFYVFQQFLDNLLKRNHQEKVKKQKIEDVNDPEVFDRLCRDNKPCMIAIRENYKPTKVEQEVELLEKLKNYYISQNFVWTWLDGNCHTEVLKKFELTPEQLPTLVYYNNKRKSYVRMKKSFELNNMIKFVDKTLELKNLWDVAAKLKEEIDPDENDCKAINEKLKEKLKAKKPEL